MCWACILMAGRWVAHPEEVGYDLAKALHEAHGDLVELRIARRRQVVRGPFGYHQQTGESFVYWAFNEDAFEPGHLPPYYVEHPIPYPECVELDCHMHPWTG